MLAEARSALMAKASFLSSVLAAMEVPGFDARIVLPTGIGSACVLLIDGLGAELLDRHADDAPVLSGLRGDTLQVGFPSTTVASLASIGTGCRSGAHGMVGYTFRMPGAGVVNPLRWRPHPWGEDLREVVPGLRAGTQVGRFPGEALGPFG